MYIYKITNKLNGLSYIGQTHNVFERWRQHCARKNRTLGIAIEKDGIENFTFEILEKTNSDLVNEREYYWINHYKSYPEGYNSNPGLISNKEKKEEKEKKKEKEDKKEKEKKHTHRTPNWAGHPVVALDPKTNEVIQIFDSIAEAQEFCKCGNSGNISAVCRGRGRTAYGYAWKYLEDLE